MMSKWSVWDCRMWGGKEFHILGAEIRKAREPNEKLWRGTESEWLADEHVNLAGLWYCKSSARYGGWPVCSVFGLRRKVWTWLELPENFIKTRKLSKRKDDRAMRRIYGCIAAFVLSTQLFPTPPLISSKFPHVRLGVGGWPLGYEERRCWANCPCN